MTPARRDGDREEKIRTRHRRAASRLCCRRPLHGAPDAWAAGSAPEPAGQARGKPGEWGSLGPHGVYIVAADARTVDAAWERVRRRDSVVVLRDLHDTEYGSHQFDVRDADGNLWTMGTYRGA